jgi:hypothetical protein
MALPANTYTTFTSIGQREDLADVIYNISPTDTPFMSSIPKVKASAVTHEWQTDALAAAAANAQLEGDDATADAATPTVRLNNRCQISRKVVSVTGTARKVATAGRADEKTYQTLKKGKELKRDMEFILTQNQGSAAPTGAGTARTTASLESWLSTNKTTVGSTAATATTPGFSSGSVAAPTDTTTSGTFTKAILDAIIQQCWTQGGMPTEIMVGPRNRTTISGFTGISTLQTDATKSADVTLIGAVDFYKSNFGILKVVPNRFQRDRTAFVLDKDYWALAVLRDMETTPLAKTGDSDRAMMITEYCLESKNQAASGKITDILTT